jgi:hypothetical protein
MRIWRVGFLLFLAAPLCFGRAQQATHTVNWGTVEGVVIDGEGKPVPGATVTSYTEARGTARNVMQFQANGKGEFSFHVQEGTVWLSAHKDSAGYPYSFFAFYITTGQEFPTVNVTAGQTTRSVVVRVGAKAAHINYEVVDEDGKPVMGRFMFVRPDQPDGPYSTSAIAKDDLLVPPVPFRVTFEAEGYRPWHFGGDSWKGKEGIISLKSGEVLNLTIRLQHDRARAAP